MDPDDALRDKLRIDVAERYTIEDDDRAYFFVRVTSKEAIADVELFLDRPSGRVAIPRAAIVGTGPCSETATCLAVALPPGLGPHSAEDRMALAVARLGHEHRGPIAARALGRYALTAEALDGNTKIAAAIDDPIERHLALSRPDALLAGFRFPRDFESVTLSGGCNRSASPLDTAWTALPAARFTVDAAFPEGDDPRVCLSVRPRAPAGGAAVVSRSVPARAVVTTFEHVYAPPLETSPLVFVPFFDLELPSEARCAEAEGLVSSAVVDAARGIATDEGSGTEVLMLPAVQIAVKEGVLCKQTNQRRFSWPRVADEIRDALDSRFGAERRVRVVLVYVTNLDLAPPSGLVDDFVALQNTFLAGSARQAAVLAIAPPRAAQSIRADVTIPYGASEEPAFRAAIVTTLRAELWPFRTVLHTADTVVPLLAASDAGRFSMWRLCDSSQPVSPIGAPVDSVLAVEGGGPAYRVELAPQVLLPPPELRPVLVRVRWEGCARLCDHAAPGGLSTLPWTRSTTCQ